MLKTGKIRAGIGGWTFEPWRGVFYPPKLTHAKELHYASRELPTIEINSTYYGSQKATSFAKWAGETPPDFIFTVKGPRFATNRRVLAEAGDPIARFFQSGVTLLGDKLGPLVWQFAPTKNSMKATSVLFLSFFPTNTTASCFVILWKCAIRHSVRRRSSS